MWVDDGVGVVGAALRGNGLGALGAEMGGGVEGEFARGTASGREVVGRLGLDGGRQPQGGISQSGPRPRFFGNYILTATKSRFYNTLHRFSGKLRRKLHRAVSPTCSPPTHSKIATGWR